MILSILVGAEGSTEKKSPKWLTFATSWNYMFVTLYFMLAFGLSLTQAIMDCCGKKKESLTESIPINATHSAINSYASDDNGRSSDHDKSEKIKLPWHLKVFWIIFNIAINICTLIVIGYWGLVHDYRKKIEFKFVSYLLIDRHGVNLVLMIVDFFLHKIPYRFLHFIYPLIIAIIYIIFTTVHWVLTDKPIYDFVNWNSNTGKCVAAALGMIVLIIALQLIWYWIHRGKTKLASKQKPNRLLDTEEHTPEL